MSKTFKIDSEEALGLQQIALYKPGWAKAAIVASLKTDTSVPALGSEGRSHIVEQEVILAWSPTTRNSMKELRKAAGTSGFQPVEHLATAPASYENRDPQRAGGYFLGKGYHDNGWSIQKRPTDEYFPSWPLFFATDKGFSPLARGEEPPADGGRITTVVPRMQAESILKKHQAECRKKLRQPHRLSAEKQKFLLASINVFDLCQRLLEKYVI